MRKAANKTVSEKSFSLNQLQDGEKKKPSDAFTSKAWGGGGDRGQVLSTHVSCHNLMVSQVGNQLTQVQLKATMKP